MKEEEERRIEESKQTLYNGIENEELKSEVDQIRQEH